MHTVVPLTLNLVVGLEPDLNVLGEVVVSSGVIDVAKVRETPVKVSTISPSEIVKVGNQEFPEIMNKTPVFTIPNKVVDMVIRESLLEDLTKETHLSLSMGNQLTIWKMDGFIGLTAQGLTDVASGIQLQRGLGASRLNSTISRWNSFNLYKSQPGAPGSSVQQVVGNDGYTKTTVSHSTGLSDNGWATSVLLSKWAGDGYIYNTSGEGYTYFFALGYAPEDSDHSVNFSFLGFWT